MPRARGSRAPRACLHHLHVLWAPRTSVRSMPLGLLHSGAAILLKNACEVSLGRSWDSVWPRRSRARRASTSMLDNGRRRRRGRDTRSRHSRPREARRGSRRLARGTAVEGIVSRDDRFARLSRRARARLVAPIPEWRVAMLQTLGTLHRVTMQNEDQRPLAPAIVTSEGCRWGRARLDRGRPQARCRAFGCGPST